VEVHTFQIPPKLPDDNLVLSLKRNYKSHLLQIDKLHTTRIITFSLSQHQYLQAGLFLIVCPLLRTMCTSTISEFHKPRSMVVLHSYLSPKIDTSYTTKLVSFRVNVISSRSLEWFNAAAVHIQSLVSQRFTLVFIQYGKGWKYPAHTHQIKNHPLTKLLLYCFPFLDREREREKSFPIKMWVCRVSFPWWTCLTITLTLYTSSSTRM